MTYGSCIEWLAKLADEKAPADQLKKERRDLEEFIQSETNPNWFIDSFDDVDKDDDWTDFWDE